MNIIRLTLTLLVLAVAVAASDAYEPIDTTGFTNVPALRGRLITVSGAVVDFNADGKASALRCKHEGADRGHLLKQS
jgi:hypothetical protein